MKRLILPRGASAGPLIVAALCLVASLLLGACALPPRMSAAVEPLFDDAAFAAPSVSIDAQSVLAMSPPMLAHLRDSIQPKLRGQSAHLGLVDALYTRNGLKLEYDGEMTRTAAEAFEARAGNCLSLVLMTAAFAREMGLPVRFQSVQAGETWSRDGDLLLFVGHVNIALGRSARGLRFADLLADWVTVDFLPTADLQRQRAWPIEEARVIAMYMNNKSAEGLAHGRLADAYWWARAAITQDRDFSNAYNTLGVVYLRHGQAQRAEAAFRVALELEADNPHTMSNLVQALQGLGRSAEAQAVALQLQRIQPSTPFGFFELGQQAMRQGDYALARKHFEQAARRGGEYHEFHFGLAQALVKLGEFDAAAKQLELAREASTTRRLQAIYAGKLERLRGQMLH